MGCLVVSGAAFVPVSFPCVSAQRLEQWPALRSVLVLQISVACSYSLQSLSGVLSEHVSFTVACVVGQGTTSALETEKLKDRRVEGLLQGHLVGSGRAVSTESAHC